MPPCSHRWLMRPVFAMPAWSRLHRSISRSSSRRLFSLPAPPLAEQTVAKVPMSIQVQTPTATRTFRRGSLLLRLLRPPRKRQPSRNRRAKLPTHHQPPIPPPPPAPLRALESEPSAPPHPPLTPFQPPRYPRHPRKLSLRLRPPGPPRRRQLPSRQPSPRHPSRDQKKVCSRPVLRSRLKSPAVPNVRPLPQAMRSSPRTRIFRGI